jgi:hypothetical protein
MNRSLARIRRDVYYLNIRELKTVSEWLRSDFYFWVEKTKQQLTRGRPDKKINIIRNIIRVLEGKKSRPTIIPFNVVKFGTLTRPVKNSPIYYGQYIDGNKRIFGLMTKLTRGKFRFGVVAQDILLEHWKRGQVLTFGQLAELYIKYKPKTHPEWRYIEFVRKTGSQKDWKIVRKQTAKEVMKMIYEI